MEQIDYQHRSGFGCLRHRIDKTDPTGRTCNFLLCIIHCGRCVAARSVAFELAVERRTFDT
jgi:hypothetical protein